MRLKEIAISKLTDAARWLLCKLMRWLKLLPDEFFDLCDQRDEIAHKWCQCDDALNEAIKRHNYHVEIILRREWVYLVTQYRFRKAEINQLVHEQWWSID